MQPLESRPQAARFLAFRKFKRICKLHLNRVPFGSTLTDCGCRDARMGVPGGAPPRPLAAYSRINPRRRAAMTRWLANNVRTPQDRGREPGWVGLGRAAGLYAPLREERLQDPGEPLHSEAPLEKTRKSRPKSFGHYEVASAEDVHGSAVRPPAPWSPEGRAPARRPGPLFSQGGTRDDEGDSRSSDAGAAPRPAGDPGAGVPAPSLRKPAVRNPFSRQFGRVGSTGGPEAGENRDTLRLLDWRPRPRGRHGPRRAGVFGAINRGRIRGVTMRTNTASVCHRGGGTWLPAPADRLLDIAPNMLP